VSAPGQGLATDDYLNPLDEDALRASYRDGQPFRHVVIPQLLRPDFLQEVCAAYPGYAEAKALADTEFKRVNENLKLQITDAERLPESIRTLHLILASDEFRARLERITGIENLLADPTLRGAGMHMMGRGGRLDVHVDFNVLRESRLYRRLNILVYLCEDWDPAWGGAVDLWDRDVRELAGSHPPDAGRCLIFNTSENSWHGVTPVRCPPGRTRNSFAAYYYTVEPPTDVGMAHTTVFRPRPGERWRQQLLLPLQRAGDVVKRATARLRRLLPGN
jgi:Rps23 Pro-64 3,4-dihydroxylase Tpa1-like proline 4-hydroxylase